MSFSYGDHFDSLPDAYQTLLLDVLEGDQTLFVHSDEVLESWRLFDPLLRGERQDDVLVQLECVGVPGDGAHALPVLPEASGLGRIACPEHLGICEGLQQLGEPIYSPRQLLLGVGHHVDQQHRLGALLARCLDAIVDGAHVLLVEVLERHQRFLARVLEPLREQVDDAAGLVQALAEELETGGALQLVGRMQNEPRGGEDVLRARGHEPARALGVDAGAKEQLVDIDIPQPRDQFLVEEE